MIIVAPLQILVGTLLVLMGGSAFWNGYAVGIFFFALGFLVLWNSIDYQEPPLGV